MSSVTHVPGDGAYLRCQMSRLISLPLHSAIELGLGTAVMAAPFVLGFGPAGLVTAVLIGAVVVGLALAGSGDEGRGTIPISAHATYDIGLAIGMIGAGLALGIAGDGAALGALAVAGLIQVVLSANTRYSPARA